MTCEWTIVQPLATSSATSFSALLSDILSVPRTADEMVFVIVFIVYNRLFVFVMETIISFLQCIYLGVRHAFGKNGLYLWTYCSRYHEWGFDIVFRWYNWSPTDVDELWTLFFWRYSSRHSADDSKVGFRWCYNNLNSIFIMKLIQLQLGRPFGYI